MPATRDRPTAGGVVKKSHATVGVPPCRAVCLTLKFVWTSAKRTCRHAPTCAAVNFARTHTPPATHNIHRRHQRRLHFRPSAAVIGGHEDACPRDLKANNRDPQINANRRRIFFFFMARHGTRETII